MLTERAQREETRPQVFESSNAQENDNADQETATNHLNNVDEQPEKCENNDNKSFVVGIKKTLWLIFDLSSLRYLVSKIKPELKEDDKREPSTFVFWIVTIYFAAFGIASARYERRKDVLETRLTIIATQLPINNSRRGAFRRLVDIQKEKIPKRPDIKNPRLTISSFWSNDTDSDILNESKQIIISEKEKLNNLDLSRVDLTKDHKNNVGANLTRANLTGTNLTRANLTGTNLIDADLIDANLIGADLIDANLTGANLKGADLEGSKFLAIDLSGIDLSSFFDLNIPTSLSKSISQPFQCVDLYY